MRAMTDAVSGCNGQAEQSGEFLKTTLRNLASMVSPSNYPAHAILFSEKDPPQGVFVVLDGEVKLSINSSDGRRLILRIARKGEILGLASALSGNSYEMTAETLHPTKVLAIGRREFLGFLVRHPEAYQSLTEELSRNVTRACEQLRTVVLSSSAPEKLARLLLDWSEDGQVTECGARFRFSLTHEEIGEFIGTTRETVTRTLTVFKNRRLVAFQGSVLTIPNKVALQSYACA
jgi:CRP/FNR family transcriptional regulator